MRFVNRAEAGRKLAEAPVPFIRPPCVVAAIPRGGVAMPVVERFHLPLTVAYARKLTARMAPECAFGAIDEDGQTIIDASDHLFSDPLARTRPTEAAVAWFMEHLGHDG